MGSFSIRNIIIGTTAQFSSTEELTEVRLLIFLWQYHLLSEAKFCLSEGEGVSHNPRPCLPGVCVPQVRVFFESIHEQASQLRVTEVAMDNVQKNILWLQRNLGTLRSWLDQQID